MQGQYRLGILLYDSQQGARRPSGAGAPLLPVLKCAQVYTDKRRKLRLTQSRFTANRAHVRLADPGYPRPGHFSAAHVTAHVLHTGNEFREGLLIYRVFPPS